MPQRLSFVNPFNSLSINAGLLIIAPLAVAGLWLWLNSACFGLGGVAEQASVGAGGLSMLVMGILGLMYGVVKGEENGRCLQFTTHEEMILDCVTQSNRFLTAEEISERCNISLAETKKILRSLIAEGKIDKPISDELIIDKSKIIRKLYSPRPLLPPYTLTFKNKGSNPILIIFQQFSHHNGESSEKIQEAREAWCSEENESPHNNRKLPKDKDYKEIGAKKKIYFFVAQSPDGEIEGTISIILDSDLMRICIVEKTPEYRNLGVRGAVVLLTLTYSVIKLAEKCGFLDDSVPDDKIIMSALDITTKRKIVYKARSQVGLEDVHFKFPDFGNVHYTKAYVLKKLEQLEQEIIVETLSQPKGETDPNPNGEVSPRETDTSIYCTFPSALEGLLPLGLIGFFQQAAFVASCAVPVNYWRWRRVKELGRYMWWWVGEFGKGMWKRVRLRINYDTSSLRIRYRFLSTMTSAFSKSDGLSSESNFFKIERTSSSTLRDVLSTMMPWCRWGGYRIRLQKSWSSVRKTFLSFIARWINLPFETPFKPKSHTDLTSYPKERTRRMVLSLTHSSTINLTLVLFSFFIVMYLFVLYDGVGIMNTGLDVFFADVGKVVMDNLIKAKTILQQFQNLIYHYPMAFYAWFAMAYIWICRYSSQESFHFLPPPLTRTREMRLQIENIAHPRKNVKMNRGCQWFWVNAGGLLVLVLAFLWLNSACFGLGGADLAGVEGDWRFWVVLWSVIGLIGLVCPSVLAKDSKFDNAKFGRYFGHNRYGPGEFEKIETRNILGEEYEMVYIYFPYKRITLQFPIDKFHSLLDSQKSPLSIFKDKTDMKKWARRWSEKQEAKERKGIIYGADEILRSCWPSLQRSLKAEGYGRVDKPEDIIESGITREKLCCLSSGIMKCLPYLKEKGILEQLPLEEGSLWNKKFGFDDAVVLLLNRKIGITRIDELKELSLVEIMEELHGKSIKIGNQNVHMRQDRTIGFVKRLIKLNISLKGGYNLSSLSILFVTGLTPPTKSFLRHEDINKIKEIMPLLDIHKEDIETQGSVMLGEKRIPASTVLNIKEKLQAFLDDLGLSGEMLFALIPLSLGEGLGISGNIPNQIWIGITLAMIILLPFIISLVQGGWPGYGDSDNGKNRPERHANKEEVYCELIRELLITLQAEAPEQVLFAILRRNRFLIIDNLEKIFTSLERLERERKIKYKEKEEIAELIDIFASKEPSLYDPERVIAFIGLIEKMVSRLKGIVPSLEDERTVFSIKGKAKQRYIEININPERLNMGEYLATIMDSSRRINIIGILSSIRKRINLEITEAKTEEAKLKILPKFETITRILRECLEETQENIRESDLRERIQKINEIYLYIFALIEVSKRKLLLDEKFVCAARLEADRILKRSKQTDTVPCIVVTGLSLAMIGLILQQLAFVLTGTTPINHLYFYWREGTAFARYVWGKVKVGGENSISGVSAYFLWIRYLLRSTMVRMPLRVGSFRSSKRRFKTWWTFFISSGWSELLNLRTTIPECVPKGYRKILEKCRSLIIRIASCCLAKVITSPLGAEVLPKSETDTIENPNFFRSFLVLPNTLSSIRKSILCLYQFLKEVYLFILYNLVGICYAGIDILKFKLWKVIIRNNFFRFYSCGQEVKYLPDHNSVSPNAGLPVTYVLSDRNSFQRVHCFFPSYVTTMPQRPTFVNSFNSLSIKAGLLIIAPLAVAGLWLWLNSACFGLGGAAANQASVWAGVGLSMLAMGIPAIVYTVVKGKDSKKDPFRELTEEIFPSSKCEEKRILVIGARRGAWAYRATLKCDWAEDVRFVNVDNDYVHFDIFQTSRYVYGFETYVMSADNLGFHDEAFSWVVINCPPKNSYKVIDIEDWLREAYRVLTKIGILTFLSRTIDHNPQEIIAILKEVGYDPLSINLLEERKNEIPESYPFSAQMAEWDDLFMHGIYLILAMKSSEQTEVKQNDSNKDRVNSPPTTPYGLAFVSAAPTALLSFFQPAAFALGNTMPINYWRLSYCQAYLKMLGVYEREWWRRVRLEVSSIIKCCLSLIGILCYIGLTWGMGWLVWVWAEEKD